MGPVAYKIRVIELTGNVRINVTLECVLATTFALEKQYDLHILSVCVCMSVCSVSYPACNASAPFCHLWPHPPYNIFPLYPTNGTIFEKKSY